MQHIFSLLLVFCLINVISTGNNDNRNNLPEIDLSSSSQLVNELTGDYMPDQQVSIEVAQNDSFDTYDGENEISDQDVSLYDNEAYATSPEYTCPYYNEDEYILDSDLELTHDIFENNGGYVTDIDNLSNSTRT